MTSWQDESSLTSQHFIATFLARLDKLYHLEIEEDFSMILVLTTWVKQK